MRKKGNRLRYFVSDICREGKHANLFFRSALKCIYCLTTSMDYISYPEHISKTSKMLNQSRDNASRKCNLDSEQVHRKK